VPALASASGGSAAATVRLRPDDPVRRTLSWVCWRVQSHHSSPRHSTRQSSPADGALPVLLSGFCRGGVAGGEARGTSDALLGRRAGHYRRPDGERLGLDAETGESEENSGESVVPRAAFRAHEEAAELFVWLSAGVFGDDDDDDDDDHDDDDGEGSERTGWPRPASRRVARIPIEISILTSQ